MNYEVPELVYGDSLEAVIFAFVNNLPIVHEGHKLYHDFDLFTCEETLLQMGFAFNVKEFLSNKGPVLYYTQKDYFRDVLLLILAVSGLTLNHDTVNSARIKENELSFTCGNRKDRVTFEKIHLFENRKLQGFFKRKKECYVYDYFTCRIVSDPNIFYGDDDFVKEIYKLSCRQLCCYSVIKEGSLNSSNSSVVPVRIKAFEKLKSFCKLIKAMKFRARDVYREYLPISNREDVIPNTKTSEEICEEAFMKGVLTHIPALSGAYHWRIARLLLGKNGIIVTPLLEKIIRRWRMQLSLRHPLDAGRYGSQPLIDGYPLLKKK